MGLFAHTEMRGMSDGNECRSISVVSSLVRRIIDRGAGCVEEAPMTPVYPRYIKPVGLLMGREECLGLAIFFVELFSSEVKELKTLYQRRYCAL